MFMYTMLVLTSYSNVYLLNDSTQSFSNVYVLSGFILSHSLHFHKVKSHTLGVRVF